MRVQRIAIRNVLGIEELEIEPGSLTIIRGRNGLGKTSTLEAIRSVIEGGHDLTLLRTGADEGEVMLVLDDGTELRKRITEKGSSVSVRHPEHGNVRGPQGYIQRLTDALSVNPIAFLTAPAKKRGEWLLEAIPMEVTVEDLAEAIGSDALLGPIDPRWAEGHALEVIERVRKSVYDERTGTNRAAKEKRATVDQLSESLPNDANAEDAGRAGELRQAYIDRLRARDADLRDIEQGRDRRLTDLRDETQRKIDELKAAAAAQADEIKAEADRRMSSVWEGAEGELSHLNAEVATAEERERRADQIANTRRIVQTITKEVENLERRSESLTAALEGLDGLKARLLERLPFPGMEIRDGEIYHDGVAFDRLNRAQQVKVAINVARLRAGNLGLICVDGLECLDAQTFETFCERASQEDLQLIVTRVSDGALEVVSAGGGRG